MMTRQRAATQLSEPIECHWVVIEGCTGDMFGFLRRKKERDDGQPDQAATPGGTAGTPGAPSAPGDVNAVEDNPETGRSPGSSGTNREITAEKPTRAGWMQRLRGGLDKTRRNLGGLFGGSTIDDDLFEELESALLVCDAGVAVTEHLLESLRNEVRAQGMESPAQVRDALRELLRELLVPLEAPMDIDRANPLVMMIAGVNGAGKTTSIGKLAKHLQAEGKSVLLAAGDTFRAAAREQLIEWGQRNNVQVLSQDGADPAAVAFDAVSAGIARKTGIVMIDTAGRLPTQANLMKELTKIHRVIGKAMPEAPHEVLLVLDGNTGQNMVAQATGFNDAVPLTGLIVTKLDGSAKGGALAALAWARRDNPIPVYFVGVGESIDDLQGFSAAEFATALLD